MGWADFLRWAVCLRWAVFLRWAVCRTPRTSRPALGGLPDASDMSTAPSGVADYTTALSRVPHVTSGGLVRRPVRRRSQGDAGQRPAASGQSMIAGTTTFLNVNTSTDPESDSGKKGLAAVQDVPAP